jgi:hypothetical protein
VLLPVVRTLIAVRLLDELLGLRERERGIYSIEDLIWRIIGIVPMNLVSNLLPGVLSKGITN